MALKTVQETVHIYGRRSMKTGGVRQGAHFVFGLSLVLVGMVFFFLLLP